MPEMTAENAVEIVTARFHAVHKAIEKAQDAALDLHSAFLQAGRLLGVHPNDSSNCGESISNVVHLLGSAQFEAAEAHREARFIASAMDNPQPLGGGGGKVWP